MRSLAVRAAALVATAVTATMMTAFFDWRGRIVRRLADDRGTLRDVGESVRVDDMDVADPASSEIDDALADSFPASDPPSWTPGVARLTPAVAAAPA